MESPRQIAEEYRRDAADDRPLGGYTALMAAYGLGAGALAFVCRDRLPGQLSLPDLVMGSIATNTLARRVTHEPITSPIRAPFTRFKETTGPAEIAEETRGTGLRHAVGELLTCPFCLAQWIATAIVLGIAVAPRFTRTLLSVLTMVSVSDVLQLARTKAMQAVG